MVGLSSLQSQLCFKKTNFKPTKSSQLRENLCPGPEKMAAKISLKENDVPTLFPVMETMLMPSIHKTQAATRASTTMVHKRVVSAGTGDFCPW